MNVIWPRPGSYVVAVSGGVDSVTLLHLLNSREELQLTVAHFDHGIRQDSNQDRQLVLSLAKDLQLPFVYEGGRLGPEASEATARTARYKFLKQVMKKHQAQAIIMAHHQDDVLETAILNMLRGTGRKGLTALRSRVGVIRPLLGVSKPEILAYAKQRNLHWREDASNLDQTYLRNYIRHILLPRFSQQDRQDLLSVVENLTSLNQELDTLLVKHLNDQLIEKRLNRLWFNQLPQAVSVEVMATWLRSQDISNFDKKTLLRLVTAAKTSSPGKVHSVLNGYFMRVTKVNLALER